ncbi:MAG: hypothetical protein LBP19_10995 [Treponema sp.]|jgi:hypothetical protein|nr:hypothetical protein [Treponema sp.]
MNTFLALNNSLHSYISPIARTAYIMLAVGVSVLCSCNRLKSEFFILPPPTYPLSRPVIGYGVIVSSYINLSNAPKRGGFSQGYMRRGSIVTVLERRLINKGTESSPSMPETWVLVEGGYQGWIYEDDIEIYEYEEQAMTASEKMIQ